MIKIYHDMKSKGATKRNVPGDPVPGGQTSYRQDAGGRCGSTLSRGSVQRASYWRQSHPLLNGRPYVNWLQELFLSRSLVLRVVDNALESSSTCDELL